ncbi:hypothetical protein [Sphingomonas aerolata]|uniref:hypothetical protein n=1 Tax=Sphingomonas aerolata TaxID=185951 RepID=UPI002FE34552
MIAVDATTELQLNASAFTDTRDRGSDFTANRSEGADASLRLVGRGRWDYSLLGYLQTRAFASSFGSINASRSATTQSLDQYNTPATGLGARFELLPPLGEGITLRLGADIRDVSGKTQELFFLPAAIRRGDARRGAVRPRRGCSRTAVSSRAM